MKKGFTLVELLIVLAVIAALMAVATPLALNALKEAKASQVAQNFRNIKAAVENYWNTEKNTSTFNLNDLVTKGYLSSAPQNFSIPAVAADGTNPGTYNVTITYSGKDTDVTRVQSNGMPEVTATAGGDLTLTFSLQKWW
ncbi:MAG: competence type IV pilus major pilin ComGC [Fervidobacterium sp.]